MEQIHSSGAYTPARQLSPPLSLSPSLSLSQHCMLYLPFQHDLQELLQQQLHKLQFHKLALLLQLTVPEFSFPIRKQSKKPGRDWWSTWVHSICTKLTITDLPHAPRHAFLGVNGRKLGQTLQIRSNGNHD